MLTTSAGGESCWTSPLSGVVCSCGNACGGVRHVPVDLSAILPAMARGEKLVSLLFCGL